MSKFTCLVPLRSFLVTKVDVLPSAKRAFSSTAVRRSHDPMEPEIPPYQEKVGEAISTKKARLLYQSRKRGMLENGLLLSTFADRHLKSMTPALTEQYDRLINLPSNDWDIFYWATNVKPTPKEFDNEVMKMFKEHVKNTNREARYYQPEVITF
nr:PREDICTED: succinate dehydrogenase assembly factor 2, mitochondrial-like [Bemisia tabaci]